MTNHVDGGELPRRPRLTTPKIVFLVVAAAAPMAAMVGVVPLQFALGNGAGTPGTFVLAGVVLFCFGVGYAAMSRRITNTGGFYTFIGRGLGRPPAVACALIAVISYNAVAVQLVGAFGYFARLVVAQQTGLTLPWELYSGVAVAVTALLGYRQIDLSAKVLGTLMVAEIAILLILDFAVLGHKGASALPLTSFAPGTVFDSGFGISLLFAFGAFVGFESAALYGEEARDPKRSVPLATYAALIVITVFYGFTTWATVGAVGVDHVRSTAGSELGNLLFTVNDQYVSTTMTTIMSVLLCTSLFASLLALHNASSRYMYALGRDRVLPGGLGRLHPRHRSPSRGSLMQTGVNIVVTTAFAVAGLDPYLNLATSMAGLGTLGVIVLQAVATAAVIGFFLRRPDRHWWRTGLAPAIGLVGLVTATVLVVRNFAVLTGTTSAAVTSIPWLIAVAALAGLGYAWWLRRHRPTTYAALAQDPATSPQADELPAP
ncbi:APC family permease [Amycolatopsis sp.]|jgi:amino acid transporter|uniref:APC family permease n=1 Tax=Amycolatopsis sp. TaxID=37632 RepID=UPI002E0B891A|nr:APC family permease [Amycolatopsis sp.]